MERLQLRRLVVACALLTPLRAAQSQDLFEAQVYDAELVPPGHWEIDTHFLYMVRGTTESTGAVIGTDKQLHLAVEITRGFWEEFELGSYILFARLPDGTFEFAGVRLRPRFAAPDEWHLPVGISLSFEFGFPRPHYEENPSTLEIRPIIDKSFGPWYFAINPVITHALRGPESDIGLSFEPSAKIAYDLVHDEVSIGIQYFGATGPISHFLPGTDQVHMLYPNADIIVGENTLVNLGVGLGLTPAAERLILACRFTLTE